MKVSGQLYSGGIIAKAVQLTFTAGSPNTVTTDGTSANNFYVTVTGNFTLSNPTGCDSTHDMQILVWRIKQGGSGSNIITMDTQFGFGTDISSITLSTALNATDYLAARFRYVDGTSNDRFDVVAFIKGYT